MKSLKMGFVGLGQRGGMMINDFLAHPQVDIVALCDVYPD